MDVTIAHTEQQDLVEGKDYIKRFGKHFNGEIFVNLLFTHDNTGPADIRLAMFDNFGSKQHKHYKKLSDDEKVFFKGLGHTILCWCLTNVPEFEDIKTIMLESEADDYYKSIGFDFFNSSAFKHPMIATKDKLISFCQKVSRKYNSPVRSVKIEQKDTTEWLEAMGV